MFSPNNISLPNKMEEIFTPPVLNEKDRASSSTYEIYCAESDCGSGLSNHLEPVSPFSKSCHWLMYEQNDFEHAYPSPVSTSSQPKQCVSLPSLLKGDTEPCFEYGSHFGGVLDSPVIIHHHLLSSRAPLSPPSTLPMSTLALPPMGHEDYLDQDRAESSRSARTSPMQDSDSLLSPLSPEWESNQISAMSTPSSPEECYLLSRMPIDNLSDYERHPGPSSRPSLPRLDMSYDSSTTALWDMHSPSTEHMDIDYCDSPSSSDSSLSPSPPHVDSLFHDDDHAFPRTPMIRESPPLTYYDTNILSSPSLRFFSSLPPSGKDDEDMMSFSPGLPMLSLPDIDDEEDGHLILPDLPFVDMTLDLSPSVLPSSSSRSLLLLDDPNDVPPPRSPSPENYTIDPGILNDLPDPELQTLNGLRKSLQDSERAGRLRETRILEDDGPLHLAAEARRDFKRDKERSREVSTLLRLKLDERGVKVEGDCQTSPQRSLSRPKLSKKQKMNNMDQLVANMILTRHASRPFSRSTYLPRERLPPSPLSREIKPDSDEKSGFDWDDPWLALPPSWGVPPDGSDSNLLSAL